MNAPRFFRYVVWSALAVFLSACGSAPTVRDSGLVGPDSKISGDIRFVYRHSELKTTLQRVRGSVVYSENGYPEFGRFLVQNAPEILARNGVGVVDSIWMDSKDRLDMSTPVPVLLVYASSGKVSASNNATQVSFVFNAHLIDPVTRRVVWKASIDTSTWRGRDWVNRNFTQTLYDEDYAEALLNALAVRMRQDGAI